MKLILPEVLPGKTIANAFMDAAYLHRSPRLAWIPKKTIQCESPSFHEGPYNERIQVESTFSKLKRKLFFSGLIWREYGPKIFITNLHPEAIYKKVDVHVDYSYHFGMFGELVCDNPYHPAFKAFAPEFKKIIELLLLNLRALPRL